MFIIMHKISGLTNIGMKDNGNKITVHVIKYKYNKMNMLQST